MKNGNNSGQKLSNWLQKILLAPARLLINLWQKTLSPDHSWRKIYYPYGACRFYPTCSEYSKACLADWGVKGVWLSAKRIARCHPWSEGGLDLPPKRRERNLESGILNLE